MSIQNENLSLPHLYGAPIHTPRRLAGIHSAPPVGPDDLPIENYRSPEDQALALELFPRSYGRHSSAGPLPPAPAATTTGGPPQLHGRPLLLRALAGVLMRPKAR